MSRAILARNKASDTDVPISTLKELVKTFETF